MNRQLFSGAVWPRSLAIPDRTLLISVLLLLVFGLIMMASASMPAAAEKMGNAFHYVNRQALFAIIGISAGYIVARCLPLKFWIMLGPWLLLAAAALLILVLIPGIGREVNGSQRWLDLVFFNLQVSELAKLFTLVYLAGYIQRRSASISTSAWGSLCPLVPVTVLAGLILVEPDLGAAVVLLMMTVIVLFLSGMRLLPLLGALVISASALALALYLSPYRRVRLTTFLDPWADPYGNGFQLTQSLMAIGRGELTGVGLGESVQKFYYLPEAHTDFVFAVMAEELGLVGVVVLILLYSLIVWRCFRVAATAHNSGQLFGASLAFGVGIYFGLQAFINMGVNMGMLPTKGLTLPLVSYGGSSLIVMCVAVALVLRVDIELRAQRPVRKPRSRATTRQRVEHPRLPRPQRPEQEAA